MKHQVASCSRILLPMAVALSLLTSIVAPLPSAFAAAASFYVRTDGNDLCDGTTNTLGISGACAKKTIQAAITAPAVASGDTINVAPGTYLENVIVSKAVSIFGAGASSTSIVATNGMSTPLTFNTNGATVSGFTITHLYTDPELSSWSNITINNSGVNFGWLRSGNTLENSTVTLNRNGIYLNNSSANIHNNAITNNRTGINLANTVNGTQIISNIISNNWTLGLIYATPPCTCFATDFSSVTVTGNTFDRNWYTEIEIKDAPLLSTGTLDVTNNILTDTPVTYTTAPASVTSLNEPSFAAQHPVVLGGTAVKPATDLPTLRIYNSGTVNLKYADKTLEVGASQPYATIQLAITDASAGDTIIVAAGTYTEVGQIVINKNLTITGVDKVTTIIKPAQDTGASGDSRGWFLIGSGVTFNMSGVTLDGIGKNICSGIYDYGLGTIQDINIKNISCAQYLGHGIYLKNNVTVHNVRFENIGRIGVFVGPGATAAVVDGIIYIGKGVGDHLDYGIEVELGGATITNNNISNVKGVALSDGSTSAGIYATTYFGPGTSATITGNTIHDNTYAIAVGYDPTDTAVVTAHNNVMYNNSVADIYTTSTTVTVNATNNWWGSADEATIQSKISTNVNFLPYYIDAAMTTLSASPTIASANITGSAVVGSTLTANAVSVTGTPSPAASYVWKRDGSTIVGASASTYLLVLADLGAAISVIITETNGISPDASATSPATGAVTKHPDKDAADKKHPDKDAASD